MNKFKWKVSYQIINDERIYQVWRQTRELRPGEPVHSGVREYQKKVFDDKESAQKYADELNKKEQMEGKNKY